MKTYSASKTLRFILIAIVFGPIHLLAGEVREVFHQVYPLENEGSIQLENRNGAVRIRTWERAEVQVEAIKRASTQEQLDAVKIDVDSKSNLVVIKTVYPNNRKNNSTSVDYTLLVPKQSQLGKVSTINGAVEIHDVGGKVEASTSNGAVTVDGLSGETRLETINGAVKATFSALKAPVTLKTVNGSITLSLPENVTADVSGETVNGGISSSFPLKPKRHFPVGSQLRGELGEGGPVVNLSAVNGAIRLLQVTATAAEEP